MKNSMTYLKALITKFADGMKGQKGYVASIAQGVATKAKNEIRSKYSDFYTAGTYLVSGFAAGISANSYKAEAKARQMAKNAYKAAKDELDINSPSKVFTKLGTFVPAGLAVGIEKMYSTLFRIITVSRIIWKGKLKIACRKECLDCMRQSCDSISQKMRVLRLT